jgi:hypothetical protein
MPGRGLLAGGLGAAASRAQLSESNVAYECMSAARTYYTMLIDMKRRVKDAIERGEDIDTVSRGLSIGLMIVAEQVGIERMCGLPDGAASGSVETLAGIVQDMRSGNLEAISKHIDSLL